MLSYSNVCFDRTYTAMYMYDQDKKVGPSCILNLDISLSCVFLQGVLMIHCQSGKSGTIRESNQLRVYVRRITPSTMYKKAQFC